MEIAYENLQNSENTRISGRLGLASAFAENPKTDGLIEADRRIRDRPGNRKIFKKIFRNSADFAPSRRILTHKRKPRTDAFEAFDLRFGRPRGSISKDFKEKRTMAAKTDKKEVITKGLIKCPFCGAEYSPSEIFMPGELIGKADNVIKDPTGRILYVE